MLEKDTLRKADIFSGALIALLGLFIVVQATGMPMKGSWGGVQNVWFVSPALFPLLVGGMLILLGGLLSFQAAGSIGFKGIRGVFSFLISWDCIHFLLHQQRIKFYAIVFNLSLFVFLLVPRIDFFLATAFFLLACFFMFFCGEYRHLLTVLGFCVCAGILTMIFFVFDGAQRLAGLTEFGPDWLMLLLIFMLCLMSWSNARRQPELRRKYRLGLLIAVLAPLTIGIVFKYFLGVPLPHEGLIVQLLDSIRYAGLWS